MPKSRMTEVCDHLHAATDLEGIVDTLLVHLRAHHGAWHPSVALLDPTHETITRVWDRERGRLDRRELSLPVDHLPPRLVRRFMKPSAFFGALERRSLLRKVFRTTPVYEPDAFEAVQMQSLTAPIAWQSSVVLPLADHDDLLALLVIVSPRRQGFPASAMEEVLAMRTVAAMALAHRLQAAGRPQPALLATRESGPGPDAAVLDRLRHLEHEATRLAQDNQIKTERMELLLRELEGVRHASHLERTEYESLRERMTQLDHQARATTQQLDETYDQLASAQHRLNAQHDTMEFLREIFEALAVEHDDRALSRALVQRFCEAFDVDRCTLMRMDDHQELQIAAHRGVDPQVADRVRVPLGQGVAGWVAHHRKPVLMRRTGDASPVRATGVDRYNSDSFVSVPLVHRDRVLGVLNLSNKRDGRSFDETDLDRALMASAVLSLAMSAREDGGHSEWRQAA